MIYVRFPLSVRNVEGLLHERGIDICHETVRYWWNRFGPLFAVEIRNSRVKNPRSYLNWRWHLDEVLEPIVTKRRDRKAALAFLKKAMKRYGLQRS